jgi:hypothetical protein
MQNKYRTPIQINKEIHAFLKDYCDEEGLMMGRFVEDIICEKIGVEIKKRRWIVSEVIVDDK